MLDNLPVLTPEQQSRNVLALEHAEFRPWELSPDLITAGLWIAYGLFAVMWFRTALRQNEGGQSESAWLLWGRGRILVPVVARAAVARRRFLRRRMLARPRPAIRLEPSPQSA